MKMSVTHLLGADMIAQSNRELGNDIIRSNRELGDKLKSISNAEIKSKDRVDIILEEYESMKTEIKDLRHQVNRLCAIFEKIEAPIDRDIIPESVHTWWCDDHINFRRIFRVEFAINDEKLYNLKYLRGKL